MAAEIIEALPSEKITQQLQQKKAERLGKSASTSEVAPSELSTAPSAADEDGRSFSSFQSEGYIHASQMGSSSSGNGESRLPASKAQLWHDLKISCQYHQAVFFSSSSSSSSSFISCKLTHYSDYKVIYSVIHGHFAEFVDSHSTQSSGSK